MEEGRGPGAVTEYEELEPGGTHCICELYECPPALLNDEQFVKQALREAVNQGMATLLHEVSHHFHPQGVTALGLIAESHLAIHTWPEYSYAAVDVFTCGNRADAEKACRYLARTFRAGRYSLRNVPRGSEIGAGGAAHPQPVAATSQAAIA